MMLKRTRAAVTVATAFALAACTIPAQPAYAEPSDQLQQRVNEAYAQLMSYTQELELAGNKLQEVKTNLSNVQSEIESTKTEISEKEASHRPGGVCEAAGRPAAEQRLLVQQQLFQQRFQ